MEEDVVLAAKEAIKRRIPEVNIWWFALLTMLSSEKSLAYWERLKLPISRKRYKETLVFARAALELTFYPAVIQKQRIYDFQESWTEYRAADGVLDDEYLNENQLDVRGLMSDEQAKSLFDLLNSQLNFPESDVIYDWAFKYFFEDNISILETAKRFRFLLDDLETNNRKYSKNILLPEEITEEIRKFCNHIIWRNRSLEKHFSVAGEIYQMTLPNTWEMVLQDRFAEGYRSSYPATASIQKTLNYVSFHHEWQKLKEKIGKDFINLLFLWLRETLDELPSKFWSLKEEDIKRLESL